MGSKTILVVDDEKQIVELISAYLKREGFNILEAYDGRTALDMALKKKPDLILLDLMLPEINGLEICRAVRQQLSTPIIMLTARDDETDKVVCLEVGADDYITKPFSPREVLARVRAVMRRTALSAQNNDRIIVGKIEIDFAKHEVKKNGEVIALTPTEFKLLESMAKSPGRVFTRLQLIDYVQGYSFEGYERTIDAHIKNLRHKIEDDPKNPQIIKTVFGVGYRLEDMSNA